MKLIEELARRSQHFTEMRYAEAETQNNASDSAGMGFSQTTSMPNIFGGYDQYRNGTLVSSSRPNIFGGFDKTTFSLSGVANGGYTEPFGHIESAIGDILGYLETPDEEF